MAASDAAGEAGAASVFTEWLCVCAARLSTRIAEEVNSATALHRIQRGYFEDKNLPAVADFMAVLPPARWVIRECSDFSPRRRIINQSGAPALFDCVETYGSGAEKRGCSFLRGHTRVRARGSACLRRRQLDESRALGTLENLVQRALKTLGCLFQLALEGSDLLRDFQ